MKRVRKFVNGGTEKFDAKIVFNFDEKQEFIIYRYVCNSKLRWRDWRKIKGKYEFVTYEEWHNYVTKKYDNYNERELIEFSKYLNNRIRNYSSFNIVGEGIIYPALISAVVSTCISNFVSSGSSNIIAYISGFMMVILLLGYVIISLLKNVMNERNRYNMLVDYKTEIDKIINCLGR